VPWRKQFRARRNYSKAHRLSHIFDRADPYLESDAVSAVKDSPVCDFTRPAAPTPEGAKREIGGPVYTAGFDFVLEPAGAMAQANIHDAQRRLAALGAR
jgi:hypothetical protein